MTTREETIALPDGERAAATLVLPGGPPRGAVLLLQEIYGVNEFVLGKAHDLAALGYAVLCPDVFHRIRPGVSLLHDDASTAEGISLSGRYFGELDDATRVGDLLAAAAHLRGLPESPGRVGVLGYCLGGTLAYAVAAHGGADACVSYYGSGVPQLLASGLRVGCPALLHFGGSDEYLPFEQVVAVIDGLRSEPDVEVLVQPAAGHAFENLRSPRFADPVAAARSWPVTGTFLAAQLSGRG